MTFKPLVLLLALFFDIVNIIWGILDFVGVGLILGPIWNGIAAFIIGFWLWTQTEEGTGRDYRAVREGRLARRRNPRFMRILVKRIAVPFLGNSIPLAKFFPFWVWSVWTAKEKQSAPQEEQTQEQSPTKQRQAATADTF